MNFTTLLASIFLSSLLSIGSQAALEALTTVPNVELNRYMGTWHEIARLPNKHQKNCVKTQAEYSYDPKDGLVNIIKKCSLADGSEKQGHGIGRVADSTNAKLKVNFVPIWLRWLGIAWRNYWIIELDENYQSAVISEPKREHLWIISRTPNMEKSVYDGIISRLKQKGFDIGKLIISDELIKAN